MDAPLALKCFTVGAVGMGQAPGVANDSVSQVVERHGIRQAGVDPVRGLVDRPQVALRGIRIGQQELDVGVATDCPQYDADDPALGISRKRL